MATQMTPTQRNYAIQRVNNILMMKEQAVHKDCLRQEARSLTYKELVKLIKSGVLKLKKHKEDEEVGHYSSIIKVFDVEAATDYYRPSAIYDEAAFTKKMAVIREDAQKIKDRLMLGDASEALRMVNEFESELNGKKSSKQVGSRSSAPSARMGTMRG